MANGWCIRTLQRIVGDFATYVDGREIGLDLLDAYHVQLELVYRELVAAELLGEQVAIPLDSVREALALVRDALDSDNCDRQTGYQASTLHNGSSGRPRFNIPRNQLACLLEKRFTIPQIGEILGVSVRTVRRRMTEYNLSVSAFYSELTDDQLDVIVGEIQAQFPTCGNRQMQGHLLARGIRVQQHRIREAQRRVDPTGSLMRRLRTIHRRSYHVNGPLALWHIDGNHKLIRYDCQSSKVLNSMYTSILIMSILFAMTTEE